MHMRPVLVFASVIAFMAVLQAQADVTVAGPGGFTVTESFHTTAPPEKIWAVLVVPSRWWDAEHTWSGVVTNMTLDAKAGGCWCETLPNGGSAQHMAVEFVDPGKTLRLRGALGPLGTLAVTGVMGFGIAAEGDGAIVTLSYQVGGFVPVDLQPLAPEVDGVLSAQMVRLKAEAEKP
jgi:uncharacterized protein YndB with AHSA1/START domain